LCRLNIKITVCIYIYIYNVKFKITIQFSRDTIEVINGYYKTNKIISNFIKLIYDIIISTLLNKHGVHLL